MRTLIGLGRMPVLSTFGDWLARWGARGGVAAIIFPGRLQSLDLRCERYFFVPRPKNGFTRSGRNDDLKPGDRQTQA